MNSSSTSRALYRVFVAPNLRTTSSIPLFYAPAFAPKHPPRCISTPPFTPHTAIRTLKYNRDTRRQALSDAYVLDRAIKAATINLVDIDGRFHNDVPFDDAITSYNKVTHHLVQVDPGKVDEFGVPDPFSPPTCRVMTKVDLRAQFNRKLELKRREAKGRGAGPASKSLELTWAIAQGDLKHRVGRLQEFLLEGRKVEITLGPKRKGKKATAEEADSVLQAIKDAVAECKGTTEKSVTGPVGGLMTIVYEGRKLEEKKEKEAKKWKREKEEEAERQAQNDIPISEMNSTELK